MQQSLEEKHCKLMTTLLALLVPFLAILLPILSIFMILLILVQRGRGGGLVGAFGGGGGQSAFGAKAGDLFTRITVVTVIIWISACIFLLLGIKFGAAPKSGGFTARPSTPAATDSPDSNAPVTVPQPAVPEE
jgi:preprotein translocase subunit SecG